jgi:uncharacterized membrane protein YgdD (TMEM256/DUF423 family)
MENTFFLLGSLLAGIGVALGAFGAHGLRSRLSEDRVETFETGVRYQMYNSFGLLAAGYAAGHWSGSILPTLSGWLFVVGIALFSGSLYLLVLTQKRWWGAITPFGGLCFIAGWLCIALVVI